MSHGHSLPSSSSSMSGNPPIIEQTFPTLSVSVDPAFLGTFKDLQKQVSNCLKNQALLYQLIGQLKVLEDRFERLSADTESSIAGIRKDLVIASSDQVPSRRSPKKENNVALKYCQDEDEEDCEPLNNAADEPETDDDPEWKPNIASSKAAAADDDSDCDRPGAAVVVELISETELMSDKDKPNKNFACPVCDKKFNRASVLNRHEFIHRFADNKDSVNYCCTTCRAAEPKPNTTVSTSKSNRTCVDCGKVLSRAAHLVRHMLRVHGIVKNYQCQGCKESFHSTSQLKVHEADAHAHGGKAQAAGPNESTEDSSPGETTTAEQHEHGDDVEANLNSKIVCTVCSAQFKTNRQLYTHYKREHPSSVNLFPCKLCDKAAATTTAFHTAQDLARHYTSQHPTPNGLQPSGSKCPECGLKLSRPTHLKRHLLSVHSIGDKLACELCSETFIRKDRLKAHQLSEHGMVSDSVNGNARFRQLNVSAEVPCPHCQKMCNKYRLTEHMNGCQGLRPFTCDECGLGFSHRSTLRGHKLNVHNRGGRSLCTVCGKSIYGTNNFKRHLMSHNGDKPNRCETCGRAFVSRRDLKRHVQTHTGEMNYSCPQASCGRKFRLKSTLTRHVRLHTGEKPYSCELCRRSFAQRSSLVKHKMAHERGTAKTVQVDDVWCHEDAKCRRKRRPKSPKPKLTPEEIVETQMDEAVADAGPPTQVTEGVVVVDF